MSERTTRSLLAAVACLALATAAFAEGPPKPGPEHQKLGYFVGKWTTEGNMAPSPFGPGGKVASKDDCRWFEGKFAVVCHSDGTTPMGPSKSIGLFAYSTEEKVYTYYGVDNSGMTMMSVPRGTVEGDTWTYTDESKFRGKTMKARYIVKQLSPRSYTFKWELLGDDGKWSTVADGKSTKTD